MIGEVTVLLRAVNGILFSQDHPDEAQGQDNEYSREKAPLETRAFGPAETTMVVIAPGVNPFETET
jgi:hypothetical protein